MAVDNEIRVFITKHLELIDENKWQEFYDDAKQELSYYKMIHLTNYLLDVTTIEEILANITTLYAGVISDEVLRNLKDNTLYIPDNIVEVSGDIVKNCKGITLSLPGKLAENCNGFNFDKIIIREGCEVLPHNFIQSWHHETEDIYLPKSIRKFELGSIMRESTVKNIYVPESVTSLLIHRIDVDKGIADLIKRY